MTRLLEHAEFVGNCYGTPKSQVCARLESGVSVILDIEVQGAAQVKQKMPEAVTVFLAPPGLDALERRLRGRGTESEETIRARLDTARREMALAPSYDYTVINDDPDRASREPRSHPRQINRIQCFAPVNAGSERNGICYDALSPDGEPC